MRERLPVDELVPRIVAHLAGNSSLVVEAPPGAGKTTRVPPALLDSVRGEVLVLEPRRLAARLAARRVATEMGERAGETVGYQVRFESVGGSCTRLRYLTEGVLTRRMISDPELRGVDAVVLDEFHERHLEGDLALALLRRLQRSTRPDLKILVMSATLDGRPVADYLSGCPIARSEGRLHRLEIRYTPHSARTPAESVAEALTELLRAGLDGDVLVFLPGASEIRASMRACAGLAARAHAELVPLHGDLSSAAQDRAVERGDRPRIILSTNVAESSITVEGVTAVVDSGLARRASDSPWTGLPTLRVVRVSQASADQRAGRAGRLRPGRVIRLYPEADYVRRDKHDAPEISRRELSQLCLTLAALGSGGPRELAWLTEPPEEAIAAAEELLTRLEALDPSGALTRDGRRMARLPLHPRLARLAVEADNRGAGPDGCAVAAALSAGERLPQGSENHTGPSDLLLLAEAHPSPLTRRLTDQIRRSLRPAAATATSDQALLISILCAFPDRVARRRRDADLLLAAGGSARLSPASVVTQAEFLVAVDIEERTEQRAPLVRLASAIDPAWLLDLFPDRVSERSAVEWNRDAERVESVSSLVFDQLTIETSPTAQPEPGEAGRLLAAKAVEAGISRFADQEEIDAFLTRVAFASAHAPIPELTEAEIRRALEELCYGMRGFRQLKAAARDGGLLRALRQCLTAEQRRLLGEVAPERIRLPSGRRTRVHYAADKPPWVASRLQDFFGMTETPRVARGAVPLVLQLLAPNQRPVQTTTDLAGFWQRLYPEVRRELRRRYPKHSWPENPLA